jgi:hypothetical protein
MEFDPIYDDMGEIIRYRWNIEAWLNSLSPAKRRNHDRRMRVLNLVGKLYNNVPWMRWPILKVVYAFWHNLFEHGIKDTIKPRWGMMTFAYLNDGIKPTVWHTFWQITHGFNHKYSGIYPQGAPHSLKQAQEWEREWEQKRLLQQALDEGIFL